MKTIIHLTLSDLERGHLANWIDSRYGKRLATRNEVTQLCKEHIKGLAQGGAGNGQTNALRNNDRGRVGRAGEDSSEPDVRRGSSSSGGMASESHEEEYTGTPDYLTKPSAAGLTTACRRVIRHIEEEGATDTLNLGWCASVLLATGIK